MKKKVAVIFASGQGKRLSPLTKTIHKSLIKINDIPLIEYLIKYLLELKTLKEIIIITGYLQEDFFYLKDKYPNIKLIFNKYYKEYNSAYALCLLPKNIFDNDLFFISGDFVMKKNCFNDDIENNVMAALKRVNTKNNWSYKLNSEGSIIDIKQNTDINSLLASEWCHINNAWSKKLVTNFSNQKELEIMKKYFLGKYLIKRSIKDNIKIKPYMLEYNNFWDLDEIRDYERIKKYF